MPLKNKDKLATIVSQKILEREKGKLNKRGATEVRRRPNESVPYSAISQDAHLKFTTSQINYDKFETFDNRSSSRSQGRHNLSHEVLQNLKNRRSERRAFRNPKINVNGLTPVRTNENQFHLPDTMKGYSKEHLPATTHFKAMSIDTHSLTAHAEQNSKNKFMNIWAAERANKIVRYRKREEMRGILNKQKFEIKEQQKLKKLEQKSDFDEMQRRIKEYQQELKNEAERKFRKREHEIEIMKEGRDLYQRNLSNRRKLDQIETLKESPKYLEEREKQEQEL